MNCHCPCGKNWRCDFHRIEILSVNFRTFFSFFFQRLPFEMNNPAKYVIGVCIQYMFLMNVMIICKCLGIFGLGTCSMLFPLTKDMKYNLKTINDNAKRRKIRPKIVKQFSQFVQFHCELIQLSFFIQKYFRSLMIKHNAISNVRCFLPFLFQFQVDS